MKTKKQTKREAVRLFRLCFVDGMLDEGRARQVVQRIVEARPRSGLALLAYFQRLVRLEVARHTAEVESAVPLPAELHESIRAGLERTYGHGIRSSFAHKPALIGGMRIKVGSDVYDGSVRARLDALGKSF
jgi:F-type H+-transporting ATPase subunit delta